VTILLNSAWSEHSPDALEIGLTTKVPLRKVQMINIVVEQPGFARVRQRGSSHLALDLDQVTCVAHPQVRRQLSVELHIAATRDRIYLGHTENIFSTHIFLKKKKKTLILAKKDQQIFASVLHTKGLKQKIPTCIGKCFSNQEYGDVGLDVEVLQRDLRHLTLWFDQEAQVGAVEVG
jgi:predicted RNA binding protein YcfA (HicA-like mRNA interferase family)